MRLVEITKTYWGLSLSFAMKSQPSLPSIISLNKDYLPNRHAALISKEVKLKKITISNAPIVLIVPFCHKRHHGTDPRSRNIAECYPPYRSLAIGEDTNSM